MSLELALLRTYTSGRLELQTLSGGGEADSWALGCDDAVLLVFDDQA